MHEGIYVVSGFYCLVGWLVGWLASQGGVVVSMCHFYFFSVLAFFFSLSYFLL